MKIISPRPKPEVKTKELEIEKCKNDLTYFINNYVKLQHYSMGTVQATLSIGQHRFTDAMQHQSNLISLQPRRAGLTTSVLSFALWKSIFTDNSKIAIGFGEGRPINSSANVMRDMYHHLPDWMKPNARSLISSHFEFSNGSTIALSQSATRASTYNDIVLMDLAHRDNTSQFEIVADAMTQNCNVIIASSAGKHGDLFHLLWEKALTGNGMWPVRVNWHEIWPASTYQGIISHMHPDVIKRDMEGQFL